MKGATQIQIEPNRLRDGLRTLSQERFFLAMKNSGRVNLDRVSFNHHKKQFFLKATQTLFSCSDYHCTISIASNLMYVLFVHLLKVRIIVIVALT